MSFGTFHRYASDRAVRHRNFHAAGVIEFGRKFREHRSSGRQNLQHPLAPAIIRFVIALFGIMPWHRFHGIRTRTPPEAILANHS